MKERLKKFREENPVFVSVASSMGFVLGAIGCVVLLSKAELNFANAAASFEARDANKAARKANELYMQHEQEAWDRDRIRWAEEDAAKQVSAAA